MSNTAAPLFINLDEVNDAPLVIIQVKGVKHPLKPVSVRDFIKNLKDLENLALDASMLDEIEILTNIIVRGFPTLTKDEVLDWPLPHLQKIALLARNGSGEIAGSQASVEEAQKPGNVQPAT